MLTIYWILLKKLDRCFQRAMFLGFARKKIPHQYKSAHGVSAPLFREKNDVFFWLEDNKKLTQLHRKKNIFFGPIQFSFYLRYAFFPRNALFLQFSAQLNFPLYVLFFAFSVRIFMPANGLRYHAKQNQNAHCI